ncbi:MAG: hypothetical protein R3Y21_02200 [Mycoplasmatota bacterium]
MKKEEKEKIYKRIFRYMFLCLLVIYITLYFSQVTGYYEYQQSKNVVFTQEQILQFEEDINSGLNLDLAEYLDNTNTSYDNVFSKLGLSISESLGKTVKSGIEKTFTYLSKVVDS